MGHIQQLMATLGGKFTIGYAHSTPTYGLPGGKWVMESVEVDRGIHFTGYDIPVTRTSFTYTGGMRDRREREFLGFAEVVSTDLDAMNGYAAYRNVTETFDVSSYYRKGLPLSVMLSDISGNKFTETENTYYTYSVMPNSSNTAKHTLSSTVPSDTWPVAYAPVKFKENRFYEGGTTPAKSQSGFAYSMDGCGEVSSLYSSPGGTMSVSGTVFSGFSSRTDVSYSSQTGGTGQHRVISRPISEKVWGCDGLLYHHTEAQYGTGSNAAKPVAITRFYGLSAADTVVTRFAYNSSGCLKSAETYSESGKYKQSYSYIDDFLNTYPKYATDSHGLTTIADSMNLRYGLPTKVTDANSCTLRTIYDGLGRLTSMKSPNENDASPSTIDMSYSPMAVMKSDGTGILTPACAVTVYHLRQPATTSSSVGTQEDSMRVVVFTDGFGRVIQTRRESYVDNGSGGKLLRTVIDGCASYDGMGRPALVYQPAQHLENYIMAYQPAIQTGGNATATLYDVADRPILVAVPSAYSDSLYTDYIYSVEDGLMRTRVIDPNGNKSDTYSDASGKTVKNVMYRDASSLQPQQPITTQYVYDPVQRLKYVVNAEGDSTAISYDMLDRRTSVSHPASGLTRWTYDRLGNVTMMENESMRAQGDSLRYVWNVDRLMSATTRGDTVRYHYGGTQGLHTKGRVMLRVDRSGATEYGYDQMGNVSYEKRTVVVPQKGCATFETGWLYDAYGKLLEMTYPGDEKVVYHYNPSGALDRVFGGRSGEERCLVDDIGYDRFGDRVRMAYSNGTETRYTYDSYTRRLSMMKLMVNGGVIGTRSYHYDDNGNVTSHTGTAPSPFQNSFAYDPLNRLVYAKLRYGRGGIMATDTLTMAYDDMWRITSKSQRMSQTELLFPGTMSTGYDMRYSYGTQTGRHFQLSGVAETHYRTEGSPTDADNILSTHSYSYDPNGNLTYESVARKRYDYSITPHVAERKMSWDSQNRLRAISDNGYVSLYWYDADGNRTVKEHLLRKKLGFYRLIVTK